LRFKKEGKILTHEEILPIRKKEKLEEIQVFFIRNSKFKRKFIPPPSKENLKIQ